MIRRLDFSVKIGATFVLIALALTLGLSRYFLVAISLTYFPWFAFLGCTIVQARSRCRKIELVYAAGFALLCIAILFLSREVPFNYKLVGAFLGLGSLLVMAVNSVWAGKVKRMHYLYALVPSLVLVGSEWLTPPLLDWAQTRNPKTLDLYLLVFDATLHVQPSLVMGRIFERLPALRVVSMAVYFGLPLLIALVFVEQLRLNRKRALVALVIFFFTAVLGAASYNLYPACGPISLLHGDFPRLQLTFEQASRVFLEAVPITGARNAMPSLHMAWVILAWWLARDLGKWVKAICILFLFFTFTATLGTGEHYFIDLIVALPFSLAMYATFALDAPLLRAKRAWPLFGGILCTTVWLLLLRYEIPVFVKVPGLSWALILLTIGGVAYAQRQLSAARVEPAGNDRFQKLAPSAGAEVQQTVRL